MDNLGSTTKMTEENPDDAKSEITEEKVKDTDNRTTQDGTDDPDESSSAYPGTSGSNKKRKLSDSDNPNAKKVAEEREEEENRFMDLCTDAGEILGENSNMFNGSIHEAKETVIESFKYEEGKKYEDNDFTLPAVTLAYFTRHGPVSAGVARYKISKILDENENIRNELQNFTSSIKILDLGTGHGCGIMGLCSSLNKYLNRKCIHFTLVDHVKEWKPVFDTVELLIRSKYFGEASDFFQNNNISTNYLVFDLTMKSEEHEVYKRSLSEADIIVISRVFSIAITKYHCIARNVVDGMKLGALLFFIDAMGKYNLSNSFPNLKQIASEEEEDYVFNGTHANDFEVSKKCKAKCFVYRKIQL